MLSFSGRVLALVAGLGLVGLVPGGVVAGEAKTINAVEVQEADGQTRILLRGAEDAIYTAFMRQDPPRLIIEMPDVEFQGIETPIEVGNGLVKNVTLGSFGDPRMAHSMARVSIALESAVGYEIVPEGDVIAVRLGADVAGTPVAVADPEPMAEPADGAAVEMEAEPEVAGSTGTGMPEEPLADSGPQEPVMAEPADDAMAAMDAPVEPAGARITRLEADGGVVTVYTEGALESFDAFALTEPDRVVVDFWGATNGFPHNRIAFDGPVVSGVRIGQHADKVRLVLDLGHAVASHDIEPWDGGIRIHLGTPVDPAPASPAADDDGEQTAAAAIDEAPVVDEPEAPVDPAPAAPAPEAAATAMPVADTVEPAALEPGNDTSDAPDAPASDWTPEASAQTDHGIDWSARPGHVRSVHFESLPGVDRVVISLDGERGAKVVEPDPNTLLVLLPGARIDKETERRVDTREFGGAVELFSIFQTPDIPGDEVRVVLKRREPVGAELRWVGEQLHVELPRPAHPAQYVPSVPLPGQTAPAAPGPEGVRPAAGPVPVVPLPGAGPSPVPPAAPMDDLLGDDPFLDGPADPASIDILEEGGFDEEKQYQGRRVSLDFKDADIGNILRLIAEVSDLNVIAGEEVGGKVTIRLVDVPWDQALDVILLTKGLGFVRIGNILRIAPIDTLKAEREARLQERRSREKLEDLVVKLQPVNFAKAKAVAKLVKKLLTGRGSVNVDQRTNTLIIKDIPSVVHEATALVKALDTQTPQVMIEAKIVEASLDFSRALGSVWGVGWNSLGTRGGAGDLKFVDGSSPNFVGQDSGLGLTPENNFISSNAIEAPTGVLTMGLLGLDDHLLLDLQIQAQESNNKAKVISSPRVVTMDNKQATIKQGVAIAFESSDGDQVNTQFVDAVLELRVTPHITANKSIVMKIKVSRNAPQLDTLGDAIGINKNETTTETIVKDGETMVLGGIYVVDNGRSRSRVPFLADVPILGAAFRNFQVIDERRELLIFVTPSVVRVEDGGES